MTDDHAKTMTNICRFAPTCTRPFGRTDCARAWCFGPMVRPGQKSDPGAADRPRNGSAESKDG